MEVKPIRHDLKKYLKKHGLVKKFQKQIEFFTENPHHPSLKTESLHPKKLKIYSFRIDKKYRAIFIFADPDEIEIVDINDHYK